MNQFVMGASLPLAAAAVWYAVRGFRAGLPLLLATPAAMLAFGLWAVAPDLPRLAGLSGLYLRLAQDPRMDLFLWHYTIDRWEGDTPWPAAVFVLLCAALMGAAWRELRRIERRR